MPVPGNGGAVAVSRRLLVDDVYDRILGAIYTGQLAPGEKLNDAELCGWLGTSRTPIRQALARLETQGLVETAANRWTRVTPIDPVRYRRSIPVVASLYRIAAHDATPNLTPEDIADLKAEQESAETGLSEGNGDSVFDSIVAVGSILVRRAENPVLTEALNTVMPRIRRINSIYSLDTSTEVVKTLMGKAIDAVASADPDTAGEAWYAVFEGLGEHVAEHLDADAAKGKYDVH